MRLAAGERIDGYEIARPLGVGGMSEAYLAHDRQSGVAVVVKLPHTHLIGDPTLYTRFQREVEIGRRLDHPHVQRLLATGSLRDGFSPYIVMEYVEGRSLREYLAQHKPLPIDQAVAFARQLAEALAYCHRQGVVHRDLKPENVLVTEAGELKLMDFGIALLQGARRVTWGSLSPAVGTPDYMAPEQVRADRGDERTDVYAVGVILYEMLTSEVPFQGDNALSIMSQRVNQEAPPVTAARPDVPPTLASVVARALRRDPEQRYPSMDAFADDLAHLDEVVPGSFAAEAGGTGLPSAVVTWLVVVLVLVALVGIGVVAELIHRGQLLP